MTRTLALAAAGILALYAAGCSNPKEDQVRASADDFTRAVANSDWATACDLLAPPARDELESETGKPCAAALAEEQLPRVDRPGRVEVFGTMAQLTYSGETLFLARFHDTWRVLAAGCTRQSPQPYECAVKGS